MKKYKNKIIWIGIFMIFLVGIQIISSAIIINSYEKQQAEKITFTETNNPENYPFAFPVGNIIYGVNIDPNSDLFIKDDDGNIVEFDDYSFLWTLIYNSHTRIQEQQIEIDNLNSSINLLCSQSLIC